MKRPSSPLAWVFVGAAVYLVTAAVLVMRGAVSLMSAAWLLQGVEVMGPYAFFLLAAVTAVVGYGLMRGSGWARRAAIILVAAFLVSAIPAVSAAVMTQRVTPIALQAVKVVVGVVLLQRLWPRRPPTRLFEQ